MLGDIISSAIKNYDELVGHGVLYRHVLDILLEGLKAADPVEAVSRSVTVKDWDIVVADRVFRDFDRVHVVGFGKASVGMARGLHRVLGDAIYGGVVISPFPSGDIGPVKVVVGDHPIPGDRTLEASRRLVEYVKETVEPSDLLFVLISGGGSALFEVPVDDISLGDIGWVARELMKAGADIFELNTVRKHLSMVKGGGLLKLARAKHVVSLIISDVVGDRLDTIASGPTVPDETTFLDAKNILVKYGLWDRAPVNVRKWIEAGIRGEVPETLKPGDPLAGKAYNVIVASNYISLKAMEDKARSLGYNTLLLTPFLHGEARETAKTIGSIAWSILEHDKPVAKPAVVIAGGETTVTVKGSGVGGRNQELCLSLAIDLKHLRGRNIVFACMGSDGVDGNSPAAGAIIDIETYWEAREKGLAPEEYLENNDSYTFFRKLGRTIETGYTGTNVNDFIVGIIK
ncbi:glycerate kinase [Desulfurococcaceae archaeon MEX13E-LK6-19]|nr:glycerate kinase [Desulfurococcaceae archaeon MEX13E-LK6-19]